MDLFLYGAAGLHELRRIRLPRRTDDVWNGFIAGIQPGTPYGLRVHGRYDPASGQRCNPHK